MDKDIRSIPVISVSGNGLADAYESALIALWKDGVKFKTQYDKPGDPQSLDCTMNITVIDPDEEPMIHKAFPGGVSDLKEYVMEIQGAKDHWVRNCDDPNDTRWEYTYHGRFQRWGQTKRNGGMRGHYDVDQINAVITKLAKQPFTRQAQMITWMPSEDLDIFDPPCLQSIWYRIVESEGVWWLNSNIRMRSNDAWGANFMNMFGITMFNRDVIAKGIAKISGKNVRLARMNWQADSFHVYGKDIAQMKSRFIDRLDSTTFQDRTMRMDDQDVLGMYHEAEAEIVEKIRKQDKERGEA
jgi:thymidylate synthase